MTKEFMREDRYIVFKTSDLGNSLKGDEIRRLAREYAEQRRLKGKKPFECVVVEKDWPEYEPTWKAIEARVTGAQPALSEQDESVRKSWARFSNELHRSPDAPYPGMSEAFEQHFSQSFTDRDWRVESGVWAAAWKAAKRHCGQPAPSAPSVPRESIERMLTQLMDIAVSNGANSISMPDEYVEVAAWLCGIPAQPAPSVPDGWLRAIDEALVVANIGVANEIDTYEQAKAKLDSLIGFRVDVATDPAVNGGWKLVPIVSTDEMDNAGADHVDGYLSMAQSVWDAMLAAAPEDILHRANGE